MSETDLNLSLQGNNDAMSFSLDQSIKGINTYIETKRGKEYLSPIEAFNHAHRDLYRFIEQRNTNNRSISYGGIMGSTYSTDNPLDSKEKRYLNNWEETRDNIEIVTELDLEDAGTKKFYWDLREANPKNMAQPFSIARLRTEKGEPLGLRVARYYEPEILERAGIKDSTDINPEHTARLRWSKRDVKEDEWGWVQEPYLLAALDGAGGVHDKLESKYKDFPELTSHYELIDWDENPGKKTESGKEVSNYEKSRLEIAFLYEWEEPLFDMSITQEEAEKLGEHAATLHSTGLMSFLDRKPEEFFVIPHKERYQVQQRDLEYAIHTVNPNKVNGRDMQDLVHQTKEGIRNYHSSTGEISEVERKQLTERPETVKKRRKELLSETDPEMRQWLRDCMPMNIDPDVFYDRARLLEYG